MHLNTWQLAVAALLFGTVGAHAQQHDPQMRYSTRIERVAPNPFKPSAGSCAITIVLVYPGSTTVKIYSVDGREVATLLTQDLGVGEYSMTWDGLSSDGTEAPSGTYLCRLKSGVVVRTENIVLTR